MFGLGVWELALILAVVILVFGAKRLPALGEGLGKAVREFRQVKDSVTDSRPDKGEPGETREKSPAGELLPELDQIRRIKSKTDSLRRLSRWVRPGRF